MKRYQIFISSTYTDLQLERQAVLESVLKLRHIPVAMEQFISTNEEQFSYRLQECRLLHKQKQDLTLLTY